ncbi:MAG TPA: hypothetical protein VEO54_00470 [Thermoanaerobaculia bacterium]|nr:hypothetical protein [Thermoanaerobaculia bacterium]
MKSAITLISAAHAAIALASFLAVRGLSRALDDIVRVGGGIDTWSEGVSAAARWPLVAAWVAVAASLLALLLARRDVPKDRPMRSAVLAAVAIGAGIAAVFVFREAVTFITQGMLPPGTRPEIIFGHLTSASAITAVCFAAAILVALLALRMRATMHLAVLAVVVSLGVSATMIVTLRDLSASYDGVAMGRVTRLR